MENTTKTAAAMAAARVTSDVLFRAGAAHSGDLGRVQGSGVSVSGIATRDRFAPASVSSLEGPPV